MKVNLRELIQRELFNIISSKVKEADKRLTDSVQQELREKLREVLSLAEVDKYFADENFRKETKQKAIQFADELIE